MVLLEKLGCYLAIIDSFRNKVLLEENTILN